MMLSRVADCLYWMGRYGERAEHSARLLQITLNTSLEGAADEGERAAERAMLALGASKSIAKEPGLEDVRFMAVSRDAPESVLTSIFRARENARQVRDQITTEMWERLNSLYFLIRDMSQSNGGFSVKTYEQLGQIVNDLHAFKGSTEGTMLHGEGYKFLSLGRHIERAQLVSRLLDIHLNNPVGTVGEYGWVQCLRMCCALEPFIRVKTARFNREDVADFMVLDDEFPRSLRYCAREIEGLVRHVGPDADHGLRAECERLAGRLRSGLEFATLDDVAGKRGQAFIRRVGAQCVAINGEVLSSFISHEVLTQPTMAQII